MMLPSSRTSPGPRLRTAATWCVVSWLALCVGAVLAALTHDWLVLAYALNGAICAAGWVLATMQWGRWRVVALQGMALLEQIRQDPDGPPGP